MHVHAFSPLEVLGLSARSLHQVPNCRHCSWNVRPATSLPNLRQTGCMYKVLYLRQLSGRLVGQPTAACTGRSAERAACCAWCDVSQHTPGRLYRGWMLPFAGHARRGQLARQVHSGQIIDPWQVMQGAASWHGRFAKGRWTPHSQVMQGAAMLARQALSTGR